METHKLSNTWVLWYHHVNDNDWTDESYTKLYKIKTIEDFWQIKSTIQTYTSGMFFLMKDDIFPRWEDINNLDGGFWSFRITKKDSDQIWENLLIALIGNTLTKNVDDMESITGVSISPKINNCIVKIWNNSAEKNDISILNDNVQGIILTDSFYKKHQDQSDFNKLTL
jgi:translation initiation factor 4E